MNIAKRDKYQTLQNVFTVKTSLKVINFSFFKIQASF